MSGSKKILVDCQDDRTATSRKDSEAHRRLRDAVVELESLLKDLRRTGSQVSLPTLRMLNWASEMLKLYCEEEVRLEDELRLFDQRYGRIVRDLTDIVRDFLEPSEDQAAPNTPEGSGTSLCVNITFARKS